MQELRQQSSEELLSLNDLIWRAGTWDAEFSEAESAAMTNLDVTDDALIFNKIRVPLDRNARNRLLARAGAPTAYLAKRSIALQSVALREHFEQGDFGEKPRIVLQGDRLFTIQSGDLVELTHSEVLTAVAEPLGVNGDGLTLSKIDRADGRMELELVSAERALEIRRDDVVKAGIHIIHSRYRDEPTQIQSFIYRLVCENGMVRRECGSNSIVRTRKLPASHPRARDLLLDQVRRLTASAWQNLEPQLQELRATSERRVNVKQLLGQWLRRGGISVRVTDGTGDCRRSIMDRLLDAWRNEGSEDTYYAAVNAFTFVASHDAELSSRQRRILSLLAGLLAFSGVHICPRCYSVLSDGAAPGNGGERGAHV